MIVAGGRGAARCACKASVTAVAAAPRASTAGAAAGAGAKRRLQVLPSFPLRQAAPLQHRFPLPPSRGRWMNFRHKGQQRMYPQRHSFSSSAALAQEQQAITLPPNLTLEDTSVLFPKGPVSVIPREVEERRRRQKGEQQRRQQQNAPPLGLTEEEEILAAEEEEDAQAKAAALAGVVVQPPSRPAPLLDGPHLLSVQVTPFGKIKKKAKKKKAKKEAKKETVAQEGEQEEEQGEEQEQEEEEQEEEQGGGVEDERSTLELDIRVFGQPIRRDVLHEVVRWQRACKRSGTAKVKNISETRGSGRKLRQQKGSGRARVGHSRAGQFRGGVKAHGPVPKDWSYKLNKKYVKLGLKVALSTKLREGNLTVVDKLSAKKPKTKHIANVVSSHGWQDSCMLAGGGEVCPKLLNATSNLFYVDVMPRKEANVYSILKKTHLILDVPAVEELTAILTAE